MINSERRRPTPVEVSPGPFDIEPVELGRLVSDGFDPAVSGEEIERRTAAWLAARLADRGVVLGAADREIIAALAAEGWSVAQVVAGWVERATHGEGPDVGVGRLCAVPRPDAPTGRRDRSRGGYRPCCRDWRRCRRSASSPPPSPRRHVHRLGGPP